MNNTNIPYNYFQNFVIRTPLFPIEFLNPIIQNQITSLKQLKNLYSMPIIRESLFLASPDLYYEFQKYFYSGIKKNKESDKLLLALMRYILRMSTRCTPFGLFAGFSLGNFADKTEINLIEKQSYKRHTRLDMNYLCALSQDLAKHNNIKYKIKYFPNSSIYVKGNQLRYIEYKYVQSKRIHHIVAVDNSEYLQKILKRAAGGEYLMTLAKLLTDEDISIEDAKEFVEELIDSQLLINELEPAVTGPEFLNQIISVIDPIEDEKSQEKFTQVLRRIRNELTRIDNTEIGSTISNYDHIIQNIKSLGTKHELKFLFQTDMIKPTLNCTLERAVVDDILSGISVLNMLSPMPSKTNLGQFRDSFYERYEHREVSLLEALDTESGIGYLQNQSANDLSPLVEDLIMPPFQNMAADIKWTRVSALLLNKFTDAISNQKDKIEITDKDLQDFEKHWIDMPNTFSAMIRLLTGNEDGNIFISSVGGSSATNLLGRFCHSDNNIYNYVKQITAKEEEINQNAIYAEIIHLPESRTGNILLRPVLRKFEIPYLAKSSVPENFQIEPKDLMVSVRGDRIILRSKKLNKEIIPQLSSAHNYSYNALPVYQMLCDLQTQNLNSSLTFNWGSVINENKFLPRVVYKNIILSLATWNINKVEIEQFLRIKDEKLLIPFQKWRRKNKISANVVLKDRDNELFLNLNNLQCIKILLSLVKNRHNFRLTEFLFKSNNTVVKSIEGSFTNEIIISFYKTSNSSL